jgi:hypothetical protein
VFEASHVKRKWFAPNAVRRSRVLEETKRSLIRLLLLFNQHPGITSKSKHAVKYLDFPSAMSPVPHSEELPAVKHTEIF